MQPGLTGRSGTVAARFTVKNDGLTPTQRGGTVLKGVFFS